MNSSLLNQVTQPIVHVLDEWANVVLVWSAFGR